MLSNELHFQLFDLFNVNALCDHRHYQEHDEATFHGVLRTAQHIAEQYFAPHNRMADAQEPAFDGQGVTMLDEVKTAFDAYAEAGFIAAKFPFEAGGLQLPELVSTAFSAYFMAANPSTTAYPFLTSAAANLIAHCASEALQSQFLAPMLDGRFAGTMALTEPHAGSSLADISTRAEPTSQGHYLIKGSKLYISAGDQAITDNIVHLVLAKIPGGPTGVKGISLFIVPKFRQTESGQWTQANDVNLAGLIHKLGYRGTTSTALSFGDHDDCHGYLVGEPHQGLRYMFMMMNEARIAVGFGAAVIGYAGYQYALGYAKEREQGGRAIVGYGDVKRMLLAQKAYTEGAMALCFYGASLIDEQRTAAPQKAADVAQLLDLLTPVMKAWPSEYGPKANDLAIQVLGGAGYTREYPVEQYWRDNRLNPIHEGTNGIQALDLLARKIWQHNGDGIALLTKRMLADIQLAQHPTALAIAAELQTWLVRFKTVLPSLGQKLQSAQQAALLANADNFMRCFGGVVIGWMWLKQANVAAQKCELDALADKNFYLGKLQAAQYFLRWEMPALAASWDLVCNADDTCSVCQEEWF
jgi:butyryl-CoA dehydrogenase